MTRYMSKPEVIQAVQLRWDTWGEVCDILGKEVMGPDKIHGVALTKSNAVHETPSDEANRIALWVPSPPPEGATIIPEGHYLVLTAKNEVLSYDEHVFNMHYQEVDPT